MAISLSDIKRSTIGPPRIVHYGVRGIGKTTEAAFAPAPIFLPIEDGLGQLDVKTFPQPQSYADVIECVNVLLNEQHDYQTFVLDSLDKLEPLLWDHVCATVPHEKGHKVSRIEMYGYGKGYTHALTEWRTLLGGLDALRSSRGMAIVLIAHSTIARVEAPDVDAYDRYQLRLHKTADATICDWADAVLFSKYEMTLVTSGERKRGIGKGERVVHTVERPAWSAKNRYNLPAEIKVAQPGDLWAALIEAIQPATATQPETEN